MLILLKKLKNPVPDSLLVPTDEKTSELLEGCNIELVKLEGLELSIIIKINILIFIIISHYVYLRVNKYKNLFKSAKISSRILNKSEFVIFLSAICFSKLTK